MNLIFIPVLLGVCVVVIYICTFVLSFLLHATRSKTYREVTKFDREINKLGGSNHE